MNRPRFVLLLVWVVLVFGQTSRSASATPPPINTYLNATVKALYTVPPADYHSTLLEDLVDPRVIQAAAKPDAVPPIAVSGLNNHYRIVEIRYYPDAKSEDNTPIENTVLILHAQFSPKNLPVTQLATLRRTPYTARNPWGQYLIELKTLSEPQASQMWDAALPLAHGDESGFHPNQKAAAQPTPQGADTP